MNDTVATSPKPNTVEAGAFNRRRFVEMRAQGMTPRQIARELDYLPWYVYKALRKHDLERLSGSDQESTVESPQKTKGPR